MAILFDVIDVQAEIKDRIATAPSLAVPLIFDDTLTGTIANLTQTFVSLEDLETVFPNTTKIYKCAQAHYSQNGANTSVKVGRASVGDANITASLDAIYDEDKDFFQLLSTNKNQADLVEIADWVNASSKNIIFGTSLEPTTQMLDSVDSTDFASVIAAKSYNNIFCFAHHRSGVDVSAVNLVVSSGVATVTSVGHGLENGEIVTILGHSDPLINNNVTITVIDVDTFTFTTLAADAIGENVDYYARYDFIESGLQALMLGKLIGTADWANKTIKGQTSIPKTQLTASQIQVLRGKTYLTYVDIQKNIPVTADGFMIGGRQIVDETVRVWLIVEIETGLINLLILNDKISYTDAGFQGVRDVVAESLNTQLTRTGLNPLSNIDNYTIDIASALDADPADRQAGIMPPVFVTARIGSAVRKIKINITLIV
jgi:hypothetical protein